MLLHPAEAVSVGEGVAGPDTDLDDGLVQPLLSDGPVHVPQGQRRERVALSEGARLEDQTPVTEGH